MPVSITKAWWAGNTPDVGRSKARVPDFWALGKFLMPWLRIKIAERFIAHLIKLGVEFDDLPIRVVVIGENVVSRSMASRSPDERNATPAKMITRIFNMSDIAQLKCDVMHSLIGIVQKIDGVVIWPAAQEGKEVADPV